MVSQSVYSKVCIKTSIFRAGWVPDIMIHETIDGWFEFCCCRRKNVCGLFTLQYLLLLLVEVHMISVRYISVHIYIYYIYIYVYIYIKYYCIMYKNCISMCRKTHLSFKLQRSRFYLGAVPFRPSFWRPGFKWETPKRGAHRNQQTCWVKR